MRSTPAPAEFNVGKAMSRTPSCSGTMRSPDHEWSAPAKKIMMVSCAEKTWSKCLRWQVVLRIAGGDRLLRPHQGSHRRRAAQHHDQRQQAIHHADPLMVDGGDPLAPQIRNVSLQGDPRKNEHNGQDHPGGRAHDDGLGIERDRVPVELAKQIHCSDLNAWVRCAAHPCPAQTCIGIVLKRPGAIAR